MPFSISGTVYPVGPTTGATVNLTGTASASTTVASDGTYSFTGLLSGTYAVAVVLSGYTFSVQSYPVTIVAANLTTINFYAAPMSQAPIIASDSFARANSATLGAKWTAIFGTNVVGQLQIYGGGVSAGVTASGAVGNEEYEISLWNANTFPNDQWVRSAILNPVTTGNHENPVGIIARGSGTTTQNIACYASFQDTAALSIELWRGISNSFASNLTELTSDGRANSGLPTTVAGQIGDFVTLECSGSELVVKVNGIVYMIYADTEVTSGAPGLTSYDDPLDSPPDALQNNWQAGFLNAPKFVQATEHDTGSGSLAFGSNVAQGNLLLCFQYANSGGSSVVSDSLGSTWHLLQANSWQGGGQTWGVFYAFAKSSGACTVSITNNLAYIVIAEYSNVGGIDSYSAATSGLNASGSTIAIYSPLLTPTNEQTLLVAPYVCRATSEGMIPVTGTFSDYRQYIGGRGTSAIPWVEDGTGFTDSTFMDLAHGRAVASAPYQSQFGAGSAAGTGFYSTMVIALYAVPSISGNAGIAGATVSYSGTASGNVTADASGFYLIPGLAAGSYTVTPSLAGYVFSPTSQNKTVTTEPFTSVNFTASVPSTGSSHITADLSTRYHARIWTPKAARTTSEKIETRIRTKPS